MGKEEVNGSGGVNVPADDMNGPQVAGSQSFMDKYDEEREKRLRADGVNQYIDLRRSEKYNKFVEDPWIAPNTPINSPVQDGGHCKILIIGAGFGGILFAVRLIRAGFRAEDLVIVDPAGGFGGTWYWNRYPGLMCDVESHIYLPLIEEMDYMPKRRYASGLEIYEYAEKICLEYGLHERAMFQSSVKEMHWDDDANEWILKISKTPKGGEQSSLTVRADFTVIGSGVLNSAKLPDVDGIDEFRGHMFHTARWDYGYTGGSQKSPELTGLRGKRVGLIGTGATAIQAVPEVAKWADKLYVFQRTASSVDVRNNADTDPAWWKKSVATKKGWYRERCLNFQNHVENNKPKPEKNLVNDAWTYFPSYSALIGTKTPVTMENVSEHLKEVHALDYQRQEQVRQRAKDIVKDRATAEKLQAWYPGWCKRPCFHDEYLQAFNLPSVELVDTDGKGIDRLTENGVEFEGKEYPVDLLIWSTGFRSPALGSPAGKADIHATGRGGISMEDKANEDEFLTLFGVTARGFPNCFFPGPRQAGASANNTFLIDTLATQSAYIMAEATRMVGEGKKAVVEPSQKAQEDWAMQMMVGATTFAGMRGCLPSYFNKEGAEVKDPMKAARLSAWPNGLETFVELLDDWQARGGLEGIEVSSV